MASLLLYDFAGAVQKAVSNQDPNTITKWEKAVLRQMGATGYRMARPEYDFSLLEMTKDVYKAYGIEEPSRVIIYEQKYPNAAYLRMSNTMIISTSLLEALNDKELRAVLNPENARRVKAVIGHEIGHRTQRNFLTAFAFTFTALSIVATSYLASKFKNPISNYLKDNLAGKFKEGSLLQRGTTSLGTAIKSAPWAVATIFSLVGAGVGWLLGFPSAAIQRKLELDADRKAAEKLGDPEALASALVKISQYAGKMHHMQIAPTDLQAREMGITPEPPRPEAPPSDFQKKLMEAKASHPSIEKRVKILREMAEQKQAREESAGAYRA